MNFRCNQDLNAYATGKFDLQIYSTDPYSDLLKWPANDIGYYGKLVPGSTIPGNLPSYWPNLRDDISFNSVWSYQAPYKAWDAKGNLLKVAKLGKDMVLSIGGWHPNNLLYGADTILSSHCLFNSKSSVIW